MTDTERAYINGEVELDPEPAPPRHHRILDTEYAHAHYAPGTYEWKAAPTVIICDHDHDDSLFMCPACCDDFRNVVADVPDLVKDLELAYTKQVAFLDQGVRQDADPDEAPLEWNEGASRSLRELKTAFDGWPVVAARRCLVDWQNVLRRPDLPMFAGRVSAAVARGKQVIERPPTLLDYGKCPGCGGEIRQERIRKDDADQIVRHDCGYQATLADHQVTQIEKGANEWRTATEVLKMLDTLGEPITRKQLRTLVDTEGLPRDVRTEARWVGGRLDATETYVYRLQDVRDAMIGRGRNANLLTTDQAAAVLGVTPAAIRKMVERGQLVPIRKGVRPLQFQPAVIVAAKNPDDTPLPPAA